MYGYWVGILLISDIIGPRDMPPTHKLDPDNHGCNQGKKLYIEVKHKPLLSKLYA
jgi:hypothetical protein